MHAQLTPESASEEYRKRFWSKVDKRGLDDCWEWTRARAGKGYGRVRWTDFTTRQANRVAYALMYGDPGDLDVCHTCDNPPCVNPAHLFVGTRADNMADMIAKGRRTFHGSTNQNAKLDERKVRDIRVLLAVGIPQTDIGRLYGVNHTCIYKIAKGKGWTHV